MRSETSTRRRIPSAFTALVCLAMTGAACPLDDDPGFDDWCGDKLCRWTLVDGQIAKAPTWHERDYGVELIGPTVTLAQQPNIDSVPCLEFKVIADIDPAASVYLELDFRADGTTRQSFLGYQVGAAAGVAVMPRPTFGVLVQAATYYAPIIENNFGQTHDSGGIAVQLGVRAAL